MTSAAHRGASAYFTAAEPGLDPSLFSGGSLRPEIRDYVLGHLSDFLRRQSITAGSWLHAWLAGSGISYQWKASRGNGDLDVLLGISPTRFTAANPGFGGLTRQQLAGSVNGLLKSFLWPLTAQAVFGGSTYEVTYYWNPDVTDDIRAVHPYAAWSLDSSRWDVAPDPQPPVTGFPQEWFDRTAEDAARILELYRNWSQNLADVLVLPPPGVIPGTARAALARVTAELRSIWDTLHDGRRSAFTAGGQGWADWHNFRWQAAKASGTASLLRDVIRTSSLRQAENETSLDGALWSPPR